MFLPIGDEPNLPGTPVVTYLLIGANVAIFVLICWPMTMRAVDPSDPLLGDYLRVFAGETGFSGRALLANLSAYDLFIFRHGFKPADPSLLDLLASMFLHANWAHLLGNMLFLWIFGDNIELHVGRSVYVVIYLLTGTAAVALHAMFRMDSMMPMVGASGAISGLLGCYFLWFPRNQVRVLVVLIFFIQIIRLPARLVLGFYLVVDNLLPFVLSSSDSGVAYGAHIGGFAGGLGSAALLTYLARRYHGFPVSHRGRWSRGSRPDDDSSSTEAFRRALATANWPAAVGLYTEMSPQQRSRLPEGEILALADWLVETDQLAAGLAVLQRFLSAHPKSGALPRAHLRAGLVHLHDQRLPAAHQHFLTVLDLPATADELAGARAGLAEVKRREQQMRRSRFH